MKPVADIAACREAHRRLGQTVAGLGEAEISWPSLLPGWTRAHVLTHLARNADSHAHLLEGLALGEDRRQYPSAEAREADIMAGGSRPPDELRADLEQACRRLEGSWESLPEPLWSEPVSLTVGRRPAEELVFRRLREVEVHHADLGLGFVPADWDDAFVEKELALQLARLAGRADHRSLVAWLLGRAGAPELGPW